LGLEWLPAMVPDHAVRDLAALAPQFGFAPTALDSAHISLWRSPTTTACTTQDRLPS
jgi:hypothetical protein